MMWTSVTVVGVSRVVKFWIFLKVEPSGLSNGVNVQREREESGGVQKFGSDPPEDRVASNRDVPIWKGAGTPPHFSLLVAGILPANVKLWIKL